MRKRILLLLTVLMALPILGLQPVIASPANDYAGAYFGADNFPPGCIRDMSATNPDNICYHMRTDMNGLDSPQIDVLIMVPLSPTAERDMRIMRQSIEMWEGGLDYLAGEMGLDWFAEGVNFHITVDAFDPAGGGGEFTTYPIVDPEIVVIASNPVGGIGIGIDPVDFAGDVFGTPDEGACTGVQNPFDFEAWENVPGFDSHHDGRSGTYNEDCDGAGGNICFAVNGAIDPEPNTIDFFNLFDLVSHEVGHCLTIGHVGDGAEGAWGALPSNDIMAYNTDPPGLNKCVSTLDVEGLATVMSRYLDVNGDGAIDEADRLDANDQVGEGASPFQVQHPDNHLYASGTGSPLDCPQPDLGLVPGPRTDWSPEPVITSEPVLTITSPADGTVSDDGIFDITGTVEHRSLIVEEDAPTDTAGSFDDADDDASTPVTEILDVAVEVTPTTIEATIALADIWPTTVLASPVSYSVVVNGRKFDSFVRYAVDTNPMTWDNGAAAYMPAGTSTWDVDAKTVSFHLPRTYLDAATVVAPYYVSSAANVGLLSTAVVDDTAPEAGDTIGLAGARVIGTGDVAGSYAGTVTFGTPEENVFYTEDSSFGGVPLINDDPGHVFNLQVPQTSDIEVTLSWTDDIGGTDLDLYATGAASSGTEGASADPTETFTLVDVQGSLDLRVDPYFIADPLAGTTYTLTATVTPKDSGPDSDGDGVADAVDQCPTEVGTAPTGCPDRDGDGVPDDTDVCPDLAGSGADGCPIAATEHVLVYVDGALAGSQDVDTVNGPDAFAVRIQLADGTHEVRVDWEDDGEVIATSTRSLTYNAVAPDDDGDGVPNDQDVCPGSDDTIDSDGDGIPDGCDTAVGTGDDGDGDGVADADDNCPNDANPDQANMDGDKKGDVCDSDMDGDGHSNGKEEAHGTDPADPNSYPSKGGKK